MFSGPDAVPSLREYARTLYADAKSYQDTHPIAAMLSDKLGDLAIVVEQELERRPSSQ